MSFIGRNGRERWETVPANAGGICHGRHWLRGFIDGYKGRPAPERDGSIARWARYGGWLDGRTQRGVWKSQRWALDFALARCWPNHVER